MARRGRVSANGIRASQRRRNGGDAVKIGELYYGVTIPDSEFRQLEARLRQFEQSVRAAGRGGARQISDTATAAQQAALAIQDLTGRWVGLGNQYKNNEMSVRRYLNGASAIVDQLANEIMMVEENSAEWIRLSRLRSTIGSQILSEEKALQRAQEITGQSFEHTTRNVLHNVKAYQNLAQRMGDYKLQLGDIEMLRQRDLIGAAEAIKRLEAFIAKLDEERVAIERGNVAKHERNAAMQSVNNMTMKATRSIDRASMELQGYNRHTLKSVDLTDTLTKAWLIGLGPQGYRLYLVLNVMNEGLKTVTTSMKAAATAALALGVAFKTLGILTGLAMVGAAIAGVNQFLTLEDTLADVRKTTGFTVDEIDQLTQAFQYLSTQLPSTTNELSQIAVEAGRLGIRGTRNIYEFTRAVAEMNLAVSGMGTDAATTLARFLFVIGTSMGEFGDRANEVGGILNELENNTASTAGEILNMAGGLAFLSSVAGVSMRDIFGMSAALQSMGVNAELASTNTRIMMQRMVADVAMGHERVGAYAAAAGMAREEFVELARSHNGYSKALQAMAMNLGRAGLSADEMTLALRNMGIVNSRQVTILVALAQGHETYARAIALANDETATAESIQNELAIRMGVTRVQMQLLRNRISAVVQVIGQELTPSLAAAVGWLNENTDGIATFGAGVLAIVDVIKGAVTFIIGLAQTIGAPFLAAMGMMNDFVTLTKSSVLVVKKLWDALANADFETVNYILETAEEAYSEAFEHSNIGEQFNQRVADNIVGGLNRMGAAFGIASQGFLQWDERFKRMRTTVPELAEHLDEVARAAALDIDPSLFDFDDDAKGAQRSVRDVMADLHKYIAAVDVMAEAMRARGLEFDANAEKQKALESALQELIFSFGEAANSPNVTAVLAMIEKLGLDAEAARQLIRELKEELTKKWVDKLSLFLDFRVETHQATFNLAQDAVGRLRAELEEMLATGDPLDWAEVNSLRERIKAVEGFRDALFETALALETLRGVGGPATDLAAERRVSLGNIASLLPDLEARNVELEFMFELPDGWDNPLFEIYDTLMLAAGMVGEAGDAARLALEKYQHVWRDLFAFENVGRIAASSTVGDSVVSVRVDLTEGDLRGAELLQENLDEIIRLWDELNNIRPVDMFGNVTDIDSEAAVQNLARIEARLYALVAAGGEAGEMAQSVLDITAGIRAPGVSMVDIGDDRVPAGADQLARDLERVNELMDQFERVMGTGRATTETMYQTLTRLAEGTGIVAEAARGLVQQMYDTFDAGVQASIDSLLEWDALIRATMVVPTGSYEALTNEIELLTAQIGIQEAALSDARDQFGAASPEVAALQEKIRALRVELLALEQQEADAANRRLQIERDAEAAIARRAAQQNNLANAIQNITSYLAPEITQTQALIQEYEKLANLMEGPMAAGLQVYINMLKDRDATEGAQALADAQREIARMTGDAEDQFIAFIPTLRRIAELYPDMADEAREFIDVLKGLSAAAEQDKLDEVLKGAMERVAQLAGEAPNQFDAYIGVLEELKLEYPKIAKEIDALIARMKVLSAQHETTQELEEFADKLQVGLGVARKMFDLMQDGNWTDGNQLIEAVYEIGAAVVSMIPVVGPALGKIVSMVGEFVNAIIGDLSNGIKQVEEGIQSLADSNQFIHIDLAEALTVTQQVSRGGVLGWLGFTKTAINQELTDLNVEMANAFGGAMQSGIQQALQGNDKWRDTLKAGIKEAVVNALITGFIEAALMKAGIEEFVVEFNRRLAEESAESAREFAALHIEALTETVEESAEIIVDALDDYATKTVEKVEAMSSTVGRGLASAFSAGILAAARGQGGWQEDLAQGVKDAIVSALIEAFVEAQMAQAQMKDFIDTFNDILLDSGADAARRYAEQNLEAITDTLLEGAEILGDTLSRFVEQVVDEVEDIGAALRDAIGGALGRGIVDAVQGDAEWRDRLNESIRRTVADALIDAFVEAMMVQQAISGFVDEFMRVLHEQGRDAALAYARDGIGSVVDDLTAGVGMVAELLEESGLLLRPPPRVDDPRDYNNDFFSGAGTPGFFQLPTASASLISATPAWINTLGMHFERFGSYVDRLVTEGIHVTVAGGGGTVSSSGVSADDLRVLG